MKRQDDAHLRHQPVCAVDDEGQRYTSAVGAKCGDWWYGALILTPMVIADLSRRGKLPLREVIL